MLERLSKFIGWGAILLVLFATAPGFCQIVQNVDGAGYIHWGSSTLRAIGKGRINPRLPSQVQRPGAIETAKLAALRNLLRVAQGVAINAETTLQQALLGNEMLTTRVQRALRRFTLVNVRALTDSLFEVEVELPLTGNFSDLLLPADFGGGQLAGTSGLCPMCGQPWPEGKPVPPGTRLVRAETRASEQDETGYTGVIVVATGLHVRPALAPRVLDETGAEIYGTKFADRDAAVQQGMVGYAKSVEQALAQERIGANPLIVHALAAKGTTRADVHVSNNDALRIHQAAHLLNFLQQCRVSVVID